MNEILNKLNPEQQKAVIATEGPTVVLAGAGSGKTRVLVHKVWYLIAEKKVSPDNILMVTFTNKAAGEMLERIKLMLSEQNIRTGTMPTVGTFHSLCAKILRRDGIHIKIAPNFVIYDTVDQQEVIKEAMALLNISTRDMKSKSVLNTISSLKNQMIDPPNYMSFARGYFQETVAKIYPVYLSLMRDHNALDFDDLLLDTVKLLRNNPEVLAKYQDKFQYIMVDEYQDTNLAQYELSKLLSGRHRNICIVGDFSQSIYSFRGADYRNLEKFKKDFPEAQTFPLSQNYRSTQNILDAAHSVISHNTTHPILSLWTDKAGGQEIELFEAASEHHEAEYIVQQIMYYRRNDPDFLYSDVAILYRMNAQSRALEEVFLHNGIPYTLVGGTRFYARKEVKDVLSYLSFLANQKDSVAYKRIDKIGKRRAAAFIDYLREFNEGSFVTEKETIAILDEVLRKTEYLELYDPKDPEDKARLENIKELRSVAIEFPNILQFLENVALVEQEYFSDKPKSQMPDKTEEKKDAVTLMTFHAAKGLEFRIVFMVGMEEGLFPHSQSFFDTNELEEERRLCYVGITRAKEKLYLTFAKRRLFFGQRTNNSSSRFLYELPESVIENKLLSQEEEPDFL